MKPALVTDFDGVINFFASRSAYSKNKDSLSYMRRGALPFDGILYNLNWSAELIRKLNDARAAHGFDWLFLSTWGEKWKDVAAHIGADMDDVIDFDPFGGVIDSFEDTQSLRKYAALIENLRANPRPFVWVDDVATDKYNADDFVGDLDVPHLIIKTDDQYGITRTHLTQIVDFLASHSD